MKNAVLLICCWLLVSPGSNGQSLRLPSAGWQVTAERYHVTAVVDRRKLRETIGEVVRGSEKTPIRFSPTLEEELLGHIATGLRQDTEGTAGLKIVVDRFLLKDVNNGGKHAISLDFKLRMVRDLAGVSQTLFELENRPSYQLIGPEVQAAYTSLITKSIEDFIRQFDRWAKQHPEQPWFMNHVVVRFAPRNTAFKGDDTLLWNPDQKLVWSDFKGKAPHPSSYSAQSNCIYALTTQQDFSSDTMLLTSVLTPCFTRKASWVESGAEQERLLEHEQLHFDLCELYARKFRKRLTQTPLSILDFDREIQALFGQLWNEYRSAQELYDEQTKHGTLYDLQMRWRQDTDVALANHEEFRTR